MPNFTSKKERNKWYKIYREKNRLKIRKYNTEYVRNMRKLKAQKRLKDIHS